jgi:putative addiction module killer protein
MVNVSKTSEYDHWINNLRDAQGRAKIKARIERLIDGNPGDVAPIGEGVSELRIHYGPGYRVYYMQRGVQLLILLAGENKATQQRDIAAALELARHI